MNCNDCINNGSLCDTMNEPFDDYSCHMTKEHRMAVESAIIQYAKRKKNTSTELLARKSLFEVARR